MNLNYLLIFLQSNLIECFVYGWCYRRKLTVGRSVAITTLANSVTHPIVFFGFMSASFSYLHSIILAEAFAILVEAVLHAWSGRLPLRLAFRASLLANLTSWQLGPILTYYIFLS
jgi:hypothetical protein